MKTLQDIKEGFKSFDVAKIVSKGECANGFFKQSIIQTIIMLAEKIRGRESVINLLQYRYDEMMKHSYIELESIRDNHLKAYNDKINKQ